ncbi:tetrapyrrole biosynthesis, uroporphyrinogen III synthase [Chytriomyces sp. MP71]|nr:tetrapyrrole biosynthesis, uroporphyrinogen III synthase [Chytriomyces sp. MP71]
MLDTRELLVFIRGNRPENDSAVTDPYADSAAKAGYAGVSVPILATIDANAPALASVLAHETPAFDRFAGIVVTSKRAVASFAHEFARESFPEAMRDCWRRLPFYTVGPSANTGIEAMGFTPLGSESGKAETLADFIIQHQRERSPAGPVAKPILFLCGDKKLGVLDQRLKAAGMLVCDLKVYETVASATFINDLDDVISRFHGREPSWIVFFSPSGVDMVLEAGMRAQSWFSAVKVASIGPTTSAHLQSSAINMPPDAVAKRPNAEDVVLAIAAFDEECALNSTTRR